MSDSGSGTANAGTNLSPSSTHHVKQLLATYAKNAPLSLTGPSAIEEQSRFSKYKNFKLNNDVSLSKVYPGESLEKSNGSSNKEAGSSTPAFEPSGPVYEQLNKQLMLQRAMRQYQEQFMLAEKERERGRERQLSGRSRQNSGGGGGSHLSGEQIRKLRENQKQQERIRAEEERRAREERCSRLDTGPGPGGKPDTQGHRQGKQSFKSPLAQNIPIMSSSDTSWSELEETSLDGEQISCFNVGGEFRLCLPQILNSVLEKVSLQAINQACDELQIYCSTCSKEQLQGLKDAKILPVAAHQCGLITKSDAERLCSYLLDKNPPRASVFDPKSSPFSFKIQHDCFGRCEGLVLPEAYTTPTARCIECLQCEGLFSPQKFVCHAHENVENRTCHWGFDSKNWRTYIKLSEDYAEEEIERHAKVMEDFKNRYNSSNSAKRRQDDDHYDKRDVPSLSKRAKTDDGLPPPAPTPPDPYAAMAMYYSKLQSFRPWSPKGGFPPLAGYPLPHPFSQRVNSLPENALEIRRPEEINNRPPSSLERFRSESESRGERCSKRKLEKDDERYPSLAEEISTVAEALTGAPVHAKETVLKILERLTQRLDRAERDRDMAIGRYRELQARFEQLEEELSKKRGELRELLRQDNRIYQGSASRDKEDETGPVNGRYSDTNGNGEAGAGKKKGASVIVGNGNGETEAARLDEDLASSSGRNRTSDNASLPKMEAKTPERPISEEAVSPRASSLQICLDSASPEVKTGPEPGPNNNEPRINNKLKESDNLQERMIKMEAELTALREELSTRSKNNNGTNGTKQPVTNHSNIANGNENSSSENASVTKKPEKQNTEVKEEQKN